MKQLTHYEGRHCANCGTPMQGEFCYRCGQSIHSAIKPIHGMLEDTIDIIFNVDHRVIHTIPPLLLKPGFLTLEYFSGRCVRYIAPFRLMFTLSLLAFFVIHLRMDAVSDKIDLRNHAPTIDLGDDFKDADSAQEVRETLQTKLEALNKARMPAVMPQAQLAEMDIAAQKVREQANQRLTALGAAPISAASLAAPPASASTATMRSASGRRADSKSWDDKKMQPIHIAWLPNMVNASLTRMGEHMLANWRTFKHGDGAAREDAKQRLIGSFFGVLPPTMFVLMPIFALLLKIFYVFKRRLYVEHLIVVLHSHAFLFLSLMLGALVALMADWAKPVAPWLAAPLGWINVALWIWAPIYLLLMQKRVYRQGWPMTIVKYVLTGWCYFVLLTFALVIAGVLSFTY
ncbi:DUF3667 domain-containing protein [Rhodanobacter sp. BL-MT-08]